MQADDDGRVELRSVAEADLPVFFEHQRDPEANAMAGFPARDEETFMKHWAKVLSDDANVTRTIVLDGHVAGNIGSWEQDGKREVGYWIGREHWGKGVATKALSGLLEDVSTRPLYAHVVRHNLASIRVLEKCGFTRVEDAGSGGEPVEEIVLRLA